MVLGGCGAIGERGVLPGTGHGSPGAWLPPSPRYQVLWLRTREGTLIAAEFCKAEDANGRPLPDPERRPTVIFFYARAVCLADESTQKLADSFRRMGVNVLIPERPGFGMSEGRPTEQGCYAAADAAYDWARQHAQGGPARIIIAGWSMGTGAAVDLASRRNASGLILVGAFTSIGSMFRTILPWPLRWLAGPLTVRCRFDNLAKIPFVTCPMLIVHGNEDTFVPERMSDELAAAARTRVTRLPVAGAHHEDIWDMGGDTLRRAIADWIQSAARD
jgi:fermentation-respiration switch protein FrsA (DUF1100 family)